MRAALLYRGVPLAFLTLLLATLAAACGSNTPPASAPPPASSAPSLPASASPREQPKPSAAAGAAAEPPERAAPSDSAPAREEPAKPAERPADPAPKAGDRPPPSAAPASPPMAAAIDHHADLRGLCDLHTQFPDDHACIPAPPPGEGMQIHIGPSNYDDPAEVAKYLLHPGDERSDCFPALTPNGEQVYFQTSVLSGRAGTHHIINTLFPAPANGALPSACTEQGLGSPNMIGNLPGASKPYMPRGTVAPEYAHVGNAVAAHVKLESEMHYFNSTDRDILREFWLNIYFVKAEQITEQASGIAGLGGFTWNLAPIAPGTDTVYTYSCPVRGDGYILSLLGHYHAHGRHFSASIARKSGSTDKVFEMYDYKEPAQFEYNSVVMNPMFSANQPGAVTGRLAVHDGDVLHWECHIVNDSAVGLTYTNAVQTGEMCNLWGSSIGVETIFCTQ